MFLKKPSYTNKKAESSERPLASFIPYSHHYNSNTIVTKRGDFVSVIKVGGFSFETADDEDLESRKNMRNNLIKGMASPDFALHIHTVRRKHSGYPAGEFDGIFTRMLNEQWRRKHHPEFTFVNEHYITLIRKVPNRIGNLSKIFNQDKTGNSSNSAILEIYREFNEMRERIVNGMWGYRVKILGLNKTVSGFYSEILEFFSFIVNIGYSQKMLVPRAGIDRYLPTNRLYVGYDMLESVGMHHHKYAGIVSLKEYRSASYAGMLDGFLHLPYEFVISQSFLFSDRMSAISKMQIQQRRLLQSEDVAVTQIQEINEALDSAMGGEFAFGKHSLSIMCIHDNIKGLDNALSQSVVEFANIGVYAVREGLNMEAAFWAQLPGNFEYIVRSSTVNTMNLASYASFHNYPAGKPSGNHWGDAVTVFNTTSGTPYFFNFHARDVGHTMIIGPTGSGKTVLLTFLSAQVQKFKPRTFFFDKDRGAEIFLRAINAAYVVIDPGKPCGFNPLQLPDTPENRNFLIDWMKLLVTCNGETLSADDIFKITLAIEGNYKLDPKVRRLSSIAPFLGINTPGSLAGRLKMWHSDGSRALVFDNPIDTIDLSSTNAFGFEMGHVLKDEVTLSPVLLYIFHRINLVLDGSPTMIVLDEAWALIDNPVFAPKLKDWLKVLRKLNAFVVFATQSVEDAANSGISDTLVQQTSTQIFLPNLKATSVYRTVFMLSEREFALVKNTDPSSRFFLVKQDNDGVVARIDLSAMDDCVRILSGRAETVTVLDQIRAKFGNDPKDWLQPFLQATAS